MLSESAAAEFRQKWLPNATSAGLRNLLHLLDSGSPLLIRNNWTSQVAFNREISDFSRGCLATHIAWFHPATAGLGRADEIH